MALLEEKGCSFERVSPLYSTPSYPSGSGPDFINAVASIRFRQDSAQLLQVLHRTEAKLHRSRSVRWGPRTVDLDLLAVGDLVLPDPETQGYWRGLPLARQLQDAPTDLILPHPRLQDRAFVLVPLVDVAPNWRHPILGKTARQMLNELPEQDKAAVKLAE